MATSGGAIDTKGTAEVISLMLKQAANGRSYSTAGRVGIQRRPSDLRDRLTRRLVRPCAVVAGISCGDGAFTISRVRSADASR